ncbi:MAG: pantetheine-phosphate adenylyltransferase [Lachnospiraceae bacterium]|nr:pantetheine-phosphate adenylyltransferase [Lachnospiraceae bacterium]MBO5387874.1 pantetheine-phosphate adenylyltransferase [Lachnospiraceae bacterium]MBR3833198.1 pantetheine-phosphate adenylyltransferase [Lachnospiraceae bacterium]
MSTAIYPGSFDPVTLGHLDIIKRSAAIFDHVVIGVLNNTAKKPLFSLEERVNMLKDAVSELDNVSVESFEGLLVDFVKQKNTNVIIRGLRALTDFDLEMQMAQSNRMVASDVDTVFLSTSLQYSYLSSSIVKEYARYGVDLKEFVPECVISKLIDKMK